MSLRALAGRRAAAVVLLVSLAALPAGCTLLQRSTSNVDQTPDEGYLQFTNGTREDRIYVDGRPVGTGADFSADRLLGVTSGAHLVEIMRDGVVVRQERVYVGVGYTRKVAVR